MLILGIIAISLLPALVQGIRYSSKQAYVATATRQVNALIEEARDKRTCTVLNGLAPSAFRDGVLVPNTDPYDIAVDDAGFICVPGVVNTMKLTSTNARGDVLAVVTAKILVDS